MRANIKQQTWTVGQAIPGAYLFRLYVCDREIFSLVE